MIISHEYLKLLIDLRVMEQAHSAEQTCEQSFLLHAARFLMPFNKGFSTLFKASTSEKFSLYKEALSGLASKILNMDLYEYQSEHFLIEAQLIASFCYGQAR